MKKKSGLSLRARGRGLGISQGYHEGDPLVLSKNRRKKEEIPICLIPHLLVLVVFNQQLEISFDKIISSAV